MLSTLLFLAAESLLFAAVLGVSWFVVRRAFALLGVSLERLGLRALPALWAVLFGINFALTRVWGPSFTALYRLSGWVLLASLALYVLCLFARRNRATGEKPA